MDLIDIKISEIKNLNLIYLYSTDNVFTKEENKYLGLKVVYNKNDYYSLDFKDKHFGTLVKRIISQYKAEKDNRNIILLGDLTAKLFKDENIKRISEERQEFNENGISLFQTNNNKLKSFIPYLNELLKGILEKIKRYEHAQIESIDGYNMKFIVTFSINKIKKSFPIILYFKDDNTLEFKLNVIDKELLGITGTIENNLHEVRAYYESKNKNARGYLLYDVIKGYVDKKIIIADETIYHQEESETLVATDIELVQFYLNLFGINIDTKFFKTSNNNYIWGFNKTKAGEEKSVLVENESMQLFIAADQVTLKYKVAESLNKYNNTLNFDLDYVLYEITMRKYYIDGNIHLLIEKTASNSFGKKYDYYIYKTGDVDFYKPFTKGEAKHVPGKVDSIYDITRVLENKGGNN